MKARSGESVRTRGPAALLARGPLATMLIVLLSLLGRPAAAQTTYTWNVSGSGVWTTAANWTPARTTPATNDILVFDGAITPSSVITGVITQGIGRMVLTNGAVPVLQGLTGSPRTLTINGGTGIDLDVPSGTYLFTSGGSGRVSLALAAGATGIIAGSMEASGLLTATDAGAITFASGGTFTYSGVPGTNPFGTTSLNSVVFQSGATYIASGGSHPFGATQPASVVVFQTGSLYRYEAGDAPSLAGRTYADFTYASGSTQTSSGSQTCTIDNLTVTSSLFHIQVSSVLIKGNIIRMGGTLDFNGSTQTITLGGASPQLVQNSGGGSSMTFGASTTLTVSNPTGVTIEANGFSPSNLVVNGGNILLDIGAFPMNISGQLTLTNGVITTGTGYVQLILPTATVVGGNSASYVNGSLRKPVSVSAGASQKKFEIGDATTYAPVTVSFPSVTTAGTLTASTQAGDHTSIGTSGLDPSRTVNRTWTLTNSATAFTPCSATFTFAPADVDAGANTAQFEVRRFTAPSTWSPTTTGTRTATTTQATGLTAFGDFAIGEVVPVYTITATTSGGGLGARTPYATGTLGSSVAIGDFNADGRPDLAVACAGANAVSVLLGTGGGAYGARINYAAGSFANGVATADLNADGILDLAVTNGSSNTVSVLLGNGAGAFGPRTDFVTGTFPTSVAIGDLNGDAFPDLAIANYNSNSISVLPGTGSGAFGAKTDFAVGSNPASVVVKDLNGDGKRDLAVANYFSDSVSILLGNGLGSFGAKTDFVTGQNPHAVAVADMNGDGKPDLVAANSNVSTVSVLLGTGTGTFGPKTDFATGARPFAVAVGDINSDGKLDIATANANANTVSVLLGDGLGGFGTHTPYGTGVDPEAIALGDLNGDGQLDVAVADYGVGTVSVLLGTGGTIAPVGVTVLTSGGNQSYTITPSGGYGIFDVLVDGAPQGAINSYAFTNVTANHTIEAQFTAGSGGATLGGVVNSALGGALLHLNGAGVLVVSNIGSSGNDGVTFPASAPDEGAAIGFAGGIPIDPDTDAGGSLVAEMMGTAAGQSASLGTIRVDVVSDGMDIQPNFADLGSGDVHVEAFLNGARVHSCRVPNGTVLHRSAPAAAARGTSGDLFAAGDGIGGVDVGLKKKPGGSLSAILSFTSGRTVNVNGTAVAASSLQFTALAPKQPISAATAVLKVARPGAFSATGRGSGAVLTASNLAEIRIQSETPVLDAIGAGAGGIRVEPAGAATFVGGTMDDGPEVVGIGSSGNDGVELTLNSTTGATHSFGAGMGFDTATDAGAFLRHRVRGKVGCVPDSTVAVGMERVYPDSITLGADFSTIGATAVKITLLDLDAVVHEATYAPGQTVRLVEPLVNAGGGVRAASINTTRSNIKDKASLAGTGVRVTTTYKRPGATLLNAAQPQAMPFDLMIGSSRYSGDELRFTAVGGLAVTELTGASLNQKNPGVARLGTLSLGRAGLSAGASAASNSSKGSAALLAVDGKIVVHNIGSSGQDGVSVKAQAPSDAISVRPVGPGSASQWPGLSAMTFTSVGQRGAGPKEELISVRSERVGSALRIGPRPPGAAASALAPLSTPATSYRMEVMMNGVVVATLDAATPQVDSDRLPDDTSCTIGGPAFEGYWDSPLTLALVGGSSQLGNGLRIRPLGVPNDVTSLSSVDVVAEGISSFEIGGWQFPVSGVTPTPGMAAGVQLTLGRNPIVRGTPLDLALTLPARAWVDLDVFDAQGRMVVSLYHGMQEAGLVNRSWTPTRAISSGMYLVRMHAAGRSVSRKFVLVQ